MTHQVYADEHFFCLTTALFSHNLHRRYVCNVDDEINKCKMETTITIE